MDWYSLFLYIMEFINMHFKTAYAVFFMFEKQYIDIIKFIFGIIFIVFAKILVGFHLKTLISTRSIVIIRTWY